MLILVSTPWFWGSRNPLRPARLSSGNQKGVIFKMASKMAAVALECNKSVIVLRIVVSLVSTPWFWGSRNPLRPSRLSAGNQKGVIFKMASKMAAVTLELQ